MLRGPGDPFSRYGFEPGHITAGGLVLSPDGAAVLLIHHRHLGIWIEPGGHVDPDDARIVDAAVREVTEETGVEGLEPIADGVFTIDAHPIPAKRSEPPHTHFNMAYAFRASSLALSPADEVHDATWQPLELVEELTSDRAVLRAVRKLTRLR